MSETINLINRFIIISFYHFCDNNSNNNADANQPIEVSLYRSCC